MISEVQRVYEFRLLSSILCNVSHLLNWNVVTYVKKGTSWPWIAATYVGKESPMEKAFWTHLQNVDCEAQPVHDDSSYQIMITLIYCEN